ncbi:hypothetical protein [Winogradskyella sp.]|uniref:hypothetical protein n=1 Tax=Winogradskyella sp. TaxID=1883156 RepID=UPI003F6C924B
MKTKLLILLPVLFISFSVFSQDSKNVPISFPDNVDAPLSKKEKAMIDEVYQSNANELVYQNANFLKDIKHLLRNRITIYKDTNPKTQKHSKLLSEVPLFNEYNSDLQRDSTFDFNSFNPLKYKLDFFTKGTYVYRIDNTDYFIQITSQYRRTKS